jgi:hypothetical protein
VILGSIICQGFIGEVVKQKIHRVLNMKEFEILRAVKWSLDGMFDPFKN